MFNVLKYNEILEKSGWSKEQSKGLIEVVSDMADHNFVTKADLNEFQLITRHNFNDIRRDFHQFKKEFQQLKIDIDLKFASFRKDMDSEFTSLKKDMDSEFTSLKKNIATLTDKLTIRLTGIMAMILGVALTLQKLL